MAAIRSTLFRPAAAKCLLTADKLCLYKVVKSLAREAFHNYGQRLYLIGKRQSQGSQRPGQKAVFMPAKWFFDRGDRDRGDRDRWLLVTPAGFHAMIALVELGTQPRRPGQRQTDNVTD